MGMLFKSALDFGIVEYLHLSKIIIRVLVLLEFYVLGALSLYTIAKRRGIRYYGLAWVPIGNAWILGSLSDQYRYVTAGKTQHRRAILLCLSLATYIFTFILVGMTFLSTISLLAGSRNPDAIIIFMIAKAGWLRFPLFAIAVTYAVFCYIALYNVFVSCKPDNAVLSLVLSILLPVTVPFFLLDCRKKDNGMPPRYARPEGEWSPNPGPKEPWEN